RFERITGHNKLGAVLRGLDLALDLGINKVKLNTVLLREHTLEDLPRFLALVKERRISLRFIELMETGLRRDYFAAQHLSGSVIEEQLIQTGWQRVPREAHAGPAIEFAHPDYAGRIGLIMPYSKNFCADCNRLRVSSRGKLHLCLFADQGIDLHPVLEHEDAEALAGFVRQSVCGKQAGHQLAQHHSGAIQHLAMIGG
ncbi:MAG: GTP 3',8-cyclase MoaA, partial [Oleiphilaceae bacterium]|nr:GTP 3',8-cyclase MoaA [Oleiphilaceae bacterium]